MSTFEDAESIRGDELAENATSSTTVPPNADPFAADGIRGNGPAENA